jgi:hypothetical protein
LVRGDGATRLNAAAQSAMTGFVIVTFYGEGER